MQDIVIPIANLIEWSFQFVELLGNAPNYLFIVLGFFGLFYWLRLQKKYDQEAAANADQLV